MSLKNQNNQPHNERSANADNSPLQEGAAVGDTASPTTDEVWAEQQVDLLRENFPLTCADRLHAVEELVHRETAAIQVRSGLCSARATQLLYRQRPELAAAWYGKEMALRAMSPEERHKWFAEAKRRYDARMAEFATPAAAPLKG